MTITPTREADRGVSSVYLETKKTWSEAQSEDMKTHGYLEFYSALSIKTNG